MTAALDSARAAAARRGPSGAGEPTAPLVRASGVRFWYGSRLVLDRVELTVDEGEFVSIIGASGCGKTTLLHLVGGILQPSEGSLLVGGHSAAIRDDTRAMVFQSFALLPWKTVLENVRLGLDYRRGDLRKRDRNEMARAYLARVGLPQIEDSYPYQLSGGMQQRVGIARAFAVRPKLLLMDEPFGALDAQNAEILREMVRQLVAEEGVTVVFVTHNLDEALQLSDRIVLMSTSPGRIHDDISLRQVKQDPDRWRLETYPAYRSRMWDFLRGQVESATATSVGSVS